MVIISVPAFWSLTQIKYINICKLFKTIPGTYQALAIIYYKFVIEKLNCFVVMLHIDLNFKQEYFLVGMEWAVKQPILLNKLPRKGNTALSRVGPPPSTPRKMLSAQAGLIPEASESTLLNRREPSSLLGHTQLTEPFSYFFPIINSTHRLLPDTCWRLFLHPLLIKEDKDQSHGCIIAV